MAIEAAAGSRLEIRAARAEDVDALDEIEHLSQQAPWTRELFEREFDMEWSRIWVVGDKHNAHRIVAFLVFWVVHDEVHILNIAVHPGARRTGMARTLLDELVRECKRHGVSYITLEVRKSNDAARALYRSFGFARIGRRKNYYSDNGEDALVMGCVVEES